MLRTSGKHRQRRTSSRVSARHIAPLSECEPGSDGGTVNFQASLLRETLGAIDQLDHALVRLLRRVAEREDAVVHQHHADRVLSRASAREARAHNRARSKPGMTYGITTTSSP